MPNPSSIDLPSTNLKSILFGIGNSNRCDDAFGPFVAESLRSDEWEAYNTETTPENYTGILRKKKAKQLVIIDAVEMDCPVGTLYRIPIESLEDYNFGTHSISLALMIPYIQRYVEKIHVIGCQPGILADGNIFSEAVKAAALKLIDHLSKQTWLTLPKLPEKNME